ncbi:MAG: HAD family phosphatase [Candidatus Diapherotrites archaeon]|nr:HAD family phosphatase [Candidatus Diapherotrites archaeon]
MIIKAIIFDFDGTLAKTNEFHLQTFLMAFEKLGLKIKRSDFTKKFGMPGDLVTKELAEKYKYHDHMDKITELKRKIYQEEFAPNAKLVDGAEDVLKFLKEKGYMLGLASGSDRKPLESVLRDASNYFDYILTASEKTKPKPHPEIFLKVAEHLGVKPENCAGIEDAFLGLEAVKNAGMFTIAASYAEFTHAEQNCAAPNLTIMDITDLKQIFNTFPKEIDLNS